MTPQLTSLTQLFIYCIAYELQLENYPEKKLCHTTDLGCSVTKEETGPWGRCINVSLRLKHDHRIPPPLGKWEVTTKICSSLTTIYNKTVCKHIQSQLHQPWLHHSSILSHFHANRGFQHGTGAGLWLAPVLCVFLRPCSSPELRFSQNRI